MLQHSDKPIESDSKGRVLRMRMGINPNSSGYGILWGGMVFLPPAVIGTVVTAIVGARLSRALKAYRENVARDDHKRSWIQLVLWGLAWIGFFVPWLVLCVAVDAQDIFFYLLSGLSALITISLVYLMGRCRELVLLRKVAVLSVIVTLLVDGLLGGVLLVFDVFSLSFLVPFLFLLALSALALALATMTVNLGVGRPIAGVVAGIVYTVVGLVLLILLPVPPVTDGMNSVGLFFYLWSWGVPPLVTILGLIAVKGKLGEDTKSPL